MRRARFGLAIAAVILATGCTSEEIDATPSSVTSAAQTCLAPGAAPTPELAALAAAVNAYRTGAPDVVARTIEACTSIATSLGVDVGDSLLFAATDEWYPKAASEVRRRCSAIQAPLLALGPRTVAVSLLGCQAPDACVDPLSAPERCKSASVIVRVSPSDSLTFASSSLEEVLYYVPRALRATEAPSALGVQTYPPMPRSLLCDQAIRGSATEETDRWAPALAAVAEALDGIARAAQVQTTCTAYSAPAR
jgi:hypothetical protein